MKKLLALILAVIMTLGVLPMTALAKEYEYEDVSGTAYISISDDDRYVVSDGKISGTIMGYVPVDLAKLRNIKLENYTHKDGDTLERFYYDADNNGKYEITVLQLFLYVLDTYYHGTSKELVIAQGPGSLFMEDGFWGHDLNLTYYKNGSYPLEREGWGATADRISVSDGDFIDLSMYTSWAFYGDGKAGYHYFEDSNGITHEYSAEIGKPLEIKYTRAWGNLNIGGATERVTSANSTIYYGKTFYDENTAQTVTTDANGKAKITFDKSGIYYLWGYGEYGADNDEDIVSSPSYCKVVVEGGSAPEILYGDVNGDGKVDIRDAIRLAKYLARIDVEINIVNADVNGDGKVNIQDLIRLKKYLAKIPLEPCNHAETETAYTSKGDGNHTVTVTCKKCGEVISTGEEVCAGDEEHTTYVSKNDGNHTKTVKCAKCDYVISTADEACTKGEDGKCAHCGYVFTTAGEDEYTITVNVAPSTVNVTFYGDEDGKTALAAEKVTDKGVVDKYHVYEVTVPEGMYSYRAVDTEDNQELGGMTFEAPVTAEIGSDGNPIHTEQKMTLVRVNYYTTNKNVKAIGDYSIDIYPGKMKEVVTGAQYINEKEQVVTPTLLHAHGNALLYNWRVNLSEELAKTYGVALSINKTFSEGASKTIEETFFLKSLVSYTVTAPKGATVRFFSQIKNFNVEELPVASATENKDGTVTSVLRAPGGNLTYRVSMEGKVTKAGYFGTDKNVTVTFGENENPKSTENLVNSKALAKRMESSTLVNVNGQNNLSLGIGETFRLRAYRGAWQIVNSDTANIMIEPDFNYAVLSGGSHIKMTPAANRCTGNAGEGEKTNWMDIEGVSEGVAIIEVSYDAIEIGGSTSYTGIYGATDPKRTSLVVINVGGAKGELSMRAIGTENPWDTEYDTVYSLENTATLNFNATLDGAEPTVQLSTDKGASWKNVKKNSDGTFTASGLVEGNNILKFTTNGKTAYQVVRAAKVTYTVTNQRENAKDIIVGDTVEIKFSGLYQPIAKFSGIYNPGFGQGHKVTYTTSDNAEFVKASGGQYDFITTNKYIVKAIAKGEVKLTGGNVHFNVMGDPEPLGGHRVLTDNGIGANFNAKSTNHIRDIFPDITIEVKEKER